MTSPRKFSEKIALHNAKQAEETAAFEQVMRDVSTVKPATNTPDTSNTNGLGYQERGGGPMRSPKRVDNTSPYSHQFLHLPPENTWRRTHSDSSLHTSSQNPPPEGLRSPGSQRRTLEEFSQGSENEHRTKRHLSASPDGRPRVPSINIYPTLQDPGAIQIPIGKSTGSLPDLTTFDIRTPLTAPIDDECVATWLPCGEFQHQPRSSVPCSLELKTSPDSYGACLTVPPQLNSSYLHTCKGLMETPQRHPHLPHQDNRPNQTQGQQQPQYAMCPQPPGSPSPLSPTYHNIHSALSPQDINSLANYRSPQPRSASPNHSEPPSPLPPSPTGQSVTGEDNFYMNQASIRHESDKSLQHEFEQFSMEDISNVTANNYYSYGQQNQHHVGGVDSNSQAPNTPSSIPDIVLTDFSTADISRWGEQVRQDLEPLDFDALQLLADPTANVSDPLTEEILRTDQS